MVTYPLPVLQALIDETHKLGKKAGCHVYGGEGQKNAIIAGCDTIEHAFRPGSGADRHDGRERPLLRSDAACATPSRIWTITTRRIPAASTASFRFSKRPCRWRRRRKGIKIMVGSGVGWRDFRAWNAGARIRSAGEARGADSGAGHPGREPRSTRRRWDGRTRSGPSIRASMPI